MEICMLIYHQIFCLMVQETALCHCLNLLKTNSTAAEFSFAWRRIAQIDLHSCAYSCSWVSKLSIQATDWYHKTKKSFQWCILSNNFSDTAYLKIHQYSTFFLLFKTLYSFLYYIWISNWINFVLVIFFLEKTVHIT